MTPADFEESECLGLSTTSWSAAITSCGSPDLCGGWVTGGPIAIPIWSVSRNGLSSQGRTRKCNADQTRCCLLGSETHLPECPHEAIDNPACRRVGKVLDYIVAGQATGSSNSNFCGEFNLARPTH